MREFYNRKSRNISTKGYEYARWFSTPVKRRQYKFSTISLLFHLKDIDFKSCLEVGCGPGTWTKLLIKKYPKAKFSCLDISKEMIRQFKENIKAENVEAIVDNFLEHDFKKKKFDFIFCSRAIEYIPNKPKVIEKFASLLKKNGKCIVVTSPPHPRVLAIKRAFGKKIDKEHTKRISVDSMHRLLKKNGFKNIEFYPILFSDFFLIPTSFLFRKFYNKRWGVVSKMFASSYLVKFEKN
jgi:SAM-dependent methyltransferase